MSVTFTIDRFYPIHAVHELLDLNGRVLPPDWLTRHTHCTARRMRPAKLRHQSWMHLKMG